MASHGRKKLGLALASGGARGFAHIGVLQALNHAGVTPDVITGTSMGAVVGAFYAAGYSSDELEQLALAFDVKTMFGIGDVALGRGALISTDRIELFLRERLPETFDGLTMPFGCVAADLASGAAARFSSGDLLKAVRASFSVPLVFPPVRTDDALYVDGFMFDPLPVAFARALGADIVVAVNVAGSGRVVINGGQAREPGVIKAVRAALKQDQAYQRASSNLDIIIATAEIVERELAVASCRQADVLLEPDVRDIPAFEFRAAPQAIAAGEAAAAAALDDIRQRVRF